MVPRRRGRGCEKIQVKRDKKKHVLMKHLKGIHRFLAESYRDSLKESSPEDEASSPGQEKVSLALRNTKRLFNSPIPEELEDVNGWSLDDATWILGGLVIYSKNFPFMNDESYVMISCTPMWQGEDELPIQINVADENPEILEIIEGVSKTLGVESYKEFEKNAIALIKEALSIAEDEIKNLVGAIWLRIFTRVMCYNKHSNRSKNYRGSKGDKVPCRCRCWCGSRSWSSCSIIHLWIIKNFLYFRIGRLQIVVNICIVFFIWRCCSIIAL